MNPMTVKRLFILFLLLVLTTTVHAQRFNTKKVNDGLRHGQWEASLLMQYQNGLDEEGEGGAGIDVDDTLGWGFTVGWNLNAKWNFQYKFSLNEPDYSATIVPGPPENPDDPQIPPFDINTSMSKYAHALNATYHFFEGPLTPFVQAGAGWTRIDSNVIDQPPSSSCWWDPWWGWICNTTWSTYDTTRFSYNLGIGGRWDVNGALFLRGSYNREWVDLKNGKMEFDVLTLEAGLMW